MLTGLLFQRYTIWLWYKQPDSIVPNTLIQIAEFYCNASAPSHTQVYEIAVFFK